jgi:hypothetical protein
MLSYFSYIHCIGTSEEPQAWNFVWIPIAGSNKGHYNLGIIREGPMSRGQVKNSSIV